MRLALLVAIALGAFGCGSENPQTDVGRFDGGGGDGGDLDTSGLDAPALDTSGLDAPAADTAGLGEGGVRSRHFTERVRNGGFARRIH